tara:strand:- start:2957 stop:3322 length:366 start_codon:yes stop_codon:yes gene_type:complete
MLELLVSLVRRAYQSQQLAVFLSPTNEVSHLLSEFGTKQQPKIYESSSFPSGEHEEETCVIDATTIDYPSPILEKIASDLKTTGLASSPLYHSFQGDPNGTLYLCVTTIGQWLVQISKLEN